MTMNSLSLISLDHQALAGEQKSAECFFQSLLICPLDPTVLEEYQTLLLFYSFFSVSGMFSLEKGAT